MLANHTGSIRHDSPVGGIAALTVPCRWAAVDIKLIYRKHCFYWRIYDGVVGEISEVESPEENCPRWGAGASILSACHCGTYRLPRPML